MLHLDLLAQIYLISFFVGGLFIVFNLFIGQIGHLTGDHHGLHLLGGHDASTHDISTGHHVGHAAHGAAHDINHSGQEVPLAGHLQNWFGNFVSAGIVERLRRSLQIFSQGDDLSSRIGMLIISFLSPMRIAIWLTFFGLTGFFVDRLLPWLSILSLIPALIIAFVASKIFNNLICLLIDSLQSHTMHNRDDVIGTIAEVNIPMTGNQIGEIVYAINSARANCAAKPVNAELEIKRGQKVMIVAMKEHIALVEPVDDPTLLSDSTNQ